MAAQSGPEAQAEFLTRPASGDLTGLAVRLQALALAGGFTVATAESCTGGLVGHVITDVPGSSAYYVGGIISYANEIKIESLDVDVTTLERHGAVSAQVALAMAKGVRARMGADFGVAVTGVAGPDGGSPEKPVGLTYVAVAGASADEVQRHVWSGDRSSNKQASAAAALELLLDVISTSTIASSR